MKITLSTDTFSRDDLMRAVQNTHNLQTAGYINSKRVKGTTLVIYWVYVDCRWIVCSTFLSLDAMLLAKYQRIVERSKDVTFQSYGVTDSGIKTNGIYCGCPNYNSKFAMFADGFKFCKHTLAYSKKYWNCQNLSQYITARKYPVNGPKMA
jgi:hypothetical protein